MATYKTWKAELTAFYCDVEELVANYLGGMERAAAYFDANPTKLRNLAEFTEERYVIGHSAYRVANDWYSTNGNSDQRLRQPLPPKTPATTTAPAAKKEPAAATVTSTRGKRKSRRRPPRFDRYRWDDIPRKVDDEREARRIEWENAKI